MDEASPTRAVPETNSVADFVEWDRQGRLRLNPVFQRRAVWSPDAKSFLIDTILLGYPIPKVYIRTTFDTETQVGIRDVVDGQQRLRAVLEFSRNQLTINRRSEHFRGKKYSDLTSDQKRSFLGYSIGVDHLISATDDIVLEVFSRLNSYTVTLNGQEKRNAQYNSDLK